MQRAATPHPKYVYTIALTLHVDLAADDGNMVWRKLLCVARKNKDKCVTTIVCPNAFI